MPDVESLPGDSKNQIERHVGDFRGQPRNDAVDRVCVVIALESVQYPSVKRLHSQADPVDTVHCQNVDFLIIEPRRIRLDAEFPRGGNVKPAGDNVEQSREMRGGEVSRCPPADEQGFDRAWRRERAQFALERLHEIADEVIFANGDSEITITAAMRAKRHMNVGSGR